MVGEKGQSPEINKNGLIKWFLFLSSNEAARFIVETSKERGKNSLHKLEALLENTESRQRLRRELKVIFQTVVAKKIVLNFLSTEQGRSLKALLE